MPLPPDVLPTALALRASLSGLQRTLRAQARAEGLGSAKLSVLAQCARHGALPAAEIARLERVKPQSLTRLLAELEADGLLQRQADPADGRRQLLSLTRAGARSIGDEAARREAALADALAVTLSAAERTQLRAACTLLERLAARLDKPSPMDASAARTPDNPETTP